MIQSSLQRRARIAFALLLTLAALGAATQAQTRTASSSASDPLASLPASDAVAIVDMRRIITELVPRVLANDATRLAQVNAELDRFRDRTGVDPRSIERLALGMRYVNLPGGATKVDTVAIARGQFNAGTIVAAGRLAAKGKYAEQKIGARTLYTFNIDEQIRMLGLLNMNVGELAITALDANTLAFGKPEIVRATMQSAGAARAGNAALVQLATRNPSALLGFGGNVPVGLLKGIDLGNPEVNNSLASVRQVFGSLANAANAYEMLLTARTTDARAARSLNETVDAGRSLAGFYVGSLSGDRGRLARSALESLRVTTAASDVNIRVALPEADVLTLVRGL